MTDTGRITLIVQDWSEDRIIDSGSKPVMVVDSLAAARFAIRTQALEMSLDITRVVVNRAASAIEALEFLTTLPHEFAGDVLLLIDDLHAFLSASGRGGDRVLYALSWQDVTFYLAANGLNRQEESTIAVRLSA